VTEITIRNRAFGAVNGAKVQVTDKLRKQLEVEQTKEGLTLLALLENGRAVRGLKHLLETVKREHPDAEIVFTHGPTRKQGNCFLINLERYRSAGSSRFFQLYRATGLDVALSFLKANFPADFGQAERTLEPFEISAVARNYPQVMEQLARKRQNLVKIIRQTSKVVRTLEAKRRLLQDELEELDRLRRNSAVAYYRDRLDELRERLDKKYPETKGKNSWQAWIYSNTWVFGSQYRQPIEKERVGLDSIPDFLFPTLDGFLDVLEIKLPTHPVIRRDKSHPGSYSWASHANKAIGQVINYIHEIEVNQLQVAKRLNEKYGDTLGLQLQAVKPRAFVLIGRSAGLNSKEKQALRSLNYSLHGIEVLTYDEILMRGEHLLALYSPLGKME